MTTWRLHSHIRVVAISLHWRNDRLLAAEVRDDAGRIKGMRPLGGETEFGESWQAALVRNFHEELGIGISMVKAMSSTRCCFHIVIASATKQSRTPPRKQSGLLRCARNDGV